MRVRLISKCLLLCCKTSPTQVVATLGRELRTLQGVHGKVWFSLLRSLPAGLAAIPERFSSSSLPPSFAPGRRAAIFSPRGTVRRGTPLVFRA